MRNTTSAAQRVERQQQIDERAARLEVPPEGAEVHAGEGDLLESGRGDPRDLADHVVDRHAAARAARGRDDAVGARLFASGLHAQRERRAPGDPGLDRGSARTVAVLRVRVARRGCVAEQILDQTVLRIVAHDADHVGQRRDVPVAARRVAAGHDHADSGVVSCDAADRLAGALIGGGGHRARVDDDEIRAGGRRVEAAARAKLLLDAQRVRLIDAAPERDDGVLHSCRDSARRRLPRYRPERQAMARPAEAR